ncbi:MAG: hypothetical protein WBP67_06320 [Thermoanaerobaculia bacterium]
MKWTVIVLVMSLGLAGSTQAQAPDPIGEEFQVNSYTTSWQVYPAVAVEPQGDFVVVWMSDGSYGTDTSGYSIQAQRYGANGAPVGGEFQVNAYTTNFQGTPAVAVEPQGDFVVVWESDGSYGTDTSSSSIQGQLYGANGAPVGDQFQVNTYTTSSQRRPAVAADAQGGFVVVWRSNGSHGTDTSDWSIQGQRYDSGGAPVGGEFQVNAYTTSSQLNPSVAVEPQGDFVVVWTSYGSYGTDSSGESIQGQRYDSGGAPMGGQFQVNAYTTTSQRRPAVAVGADGDFVVVWDSGGSFGTDNSSRSIQGQRFSVSIFSDGFESGDTSVWSNTVP